MWLRSHIQDYSFSNSKIFDTHQPLTCPVKSRKSFICRRSSAQVPKFKVCRDIFERFLVTISNFGNEILFSSQVHAEQFTWFTNFVRAVCMRWSTSKRTNWWEAMAINRWMKQKSCNAWHIHALLKCMTLSIVPIRCSSNSNSWKAVSYWRASRRKSSCPKPIPSCSSIKCAMPSNICTTRKLHTVIWSQIIFCWRHRTRIHCWKSQISGSANWCATIQCYVHCAEHLCKLSFYRIPTFQAEIRILFQPFCFCFYSYGVSYVAPEVLETSGKGEYTQKVWSIQLLLLIYQSCIFYCFNCPNIFIFFLICVISMCV